MYSDNMVDAAHVLTHDGRQHTQQHLWPGSRRCQHHRKWLIIVYVVFPSLPSLWTRNLTYPSLPHPVHRRPGTITLMIASPRTPLPHAPASLLHPATPRSHLFRRGLHTLRTHSRRWHTAPSLPNINLSPARNRTSDPSELPPRPPIAQTALGCRRRPDRLPIIIFS
jgi:hypothetical protein